MVVEQESEIAFVTGRKKIPMFVRGAIWRLVIATRGSVQLGLDGLHGLNVRKRVTKVSM